MLVGAAIMPSAPVLVDGVSAALPAGVDAVCDAIAAAVDSLPAADVAILVAAGDRGVHDRAVADLAGVGRGDIRHERPVHAAAITAVCRLIQYPRIGAERLSLGLSVLSLLLGDGPPVLPVSVPSLASFDALAAAGTGIAQALADARMTGVLIAAGDCSAGLTRHSPRYVLPGARAWDEQAVAIVDSGRLDGLRGLGPAEAQRVSALGWAPMAVSHGACARSKLGMVVRHYSAPRGVGYLVAHGA